MTAVEPIQTHKGSQRVVFGKNQPPLIPLPACVDKNGLVLTEWELTEEEQERIFMGGRIRLWLNTEVHLGKPFQPILIEAVEKA